MRWRCERWRCERFTIHDGGANDDGGPKFDTDDVRTPKYRKAVLQLLCRLVDHHTTFSLERIFVESISSKTKTKQHGANL